MKGWYRKTAMKAVVLIMGVLNGALFFTSLAVTTRLTGTLNPAETVKLAGKPYEDSSDFSNTVEGYMLQVLEQFQLKALFETDGAYNPDKVIDVMSYFEDAEADGKNHSGLVYKLSDLIEWSKAYSAESGGVYDKNAVIVCKQPSGKYYYYYTEEFLKLFETGELQITFDTEEMDIESFFNNLSNGTLTSSGATDKIIIYDAEGNELYTDCWNYGESVRENYAPVGAANLLQVVNERPELNGKLMVIYDHLSSVLTSINDSYTRYESGWEYLEEGNTNFTYLYVDQDTKKVTTNKSEYADLMVKSESETNSNIEQSIANMKSGKKVKYVFVYPKLKDFETNMEISPTTEWDMVRAYDNDRTYDSIFAVAVDTSYPIKDMFYERNGIYEENIPLLRGGLVLLCVSGILFLVSFVMAGLTAGRKEGDNEIHLTGFDQWKTELAAITVIGIWAVGTAIILGAGILESNNVGNMVDTLGYYGDRYMSDMPEFYSMLFVQKVSFLDIAGIFLYGLFTFTCFFAGYVSLIRRIKAKSLWKGSLLCSILAFGKKVLDARNDVWRVILFISVFFFLHWLAFLAGNIPMALIALAADGVTFWIVLGSMFAKVRIKKGIEQIADGNLEYRIDLKGLRGTERKIAEMVNEIGSGLNRAIDEAMRNERLKTDLITNVSHDIKTPLTSIINYVDILKRSDISDEKILGYLDILEVKAQRLKTLTEDVVEASKVSSGNITLEYMDIDFREMVQQTEGELAEKFTARNLAVVLNLPEEPAVVHVDGRRMWRVLENIFGNAAKYAMPGTRVYADLSVTDAEVRFSLKNVSEQQLNISADELTERFIRGDISRSTEGSGLGLSIAKSLTAMQGGTFELYLDGDLFKVDIRFPKRNQEKKQVSKTVD